MIEMSTLPALPGPHALLMLGLTGLALVLFSQEKIQLELSALGIFVVIVLTFALFPLNDIDPHDFFFGFAHEALISVCALMILGQGLVQTGALEPVGRSLGYLWERAPALSLLLTLAVGALLSAFVNNTPIVVLLLPILISVSLRSNQPPSKVLLPMGLATLLGGMATTIGTSTNLLVVSLAQEQGLRALGMFDFALPAVIAGAVGILYLWLIAPLLLPQRESALSDDSPRLFEARLHLTEESLNSVETLAELRTIAGSDIGIRRVLRGTTPIVPLPDLQLQVGDQLTLVDTPTNLSQHANALQAELYEETPSEEESGDQVLAEIAIPEGSKLVQTNLSEAHFFQQHQLLVLALHRSGREIWQAGIKIQNIELRAGDVLLVQGSRRRLRELKTETTLLVLDSNITLPRTDKAPLALGIVLLAIGAAALAILPIAVAGLLGVCLLLITRCLSIGAAVRAISPAIYFVVAASLALGMALQQTGATAYLTQLFLYITQGASPGITLAALMLLLALLTNVVSNNAAAVIGTPIAIGIADALSLPAEPFVLAVLFGANLSYATPMAYKTNLLVMSAGNYRFSDFLRVGLPLLLLMWLVLSALLVALYL